MAVDIDGGVGGGENVAVFIKTNFEGGAPFGETEAHLIVFAEAVGEAVQAFGPGFIGVGLSFWMIIWRGRIGKFFEALVDFDAGNDAFSSEIVYESLAIVGKLTSGFVKKNDAINVVFETFGSEEDIAIITTIVVSVGNPKLVEFFVDTATGFISSEDAFWLQHEITGN